LDKMKIGLRTLPYIAGITFAGIVVAGLAVSSDTEEMADTGYQLYHDTVDVHVYWLESKACVVLPPDGYQANCTYLGSITVMLVLTVLLIVVVAAYMVLRRNSSLQIKRQ
jgi:hypothetical protein